MQTITKLKQNLRSARLARNTDLVQLLSFAIGEVERAPKQSEAATIATIRKLIQGEKDNMSLRGNTRVAHTAWVIEHLGTYLPQDASKEQLEAIVKLATSVKEAMIMAASLEEETGVAVDKKLLREMFNETIS